MIPNKAVSCLSTPQRQGHSHLQNTQPPLSKNKTNKKICPPLKGHYFINDGSTAYELPLPGDKNQVMGVEIRQILSSGLAELHTQELVSNSQKGKKKIILSPAFLHCDNSQSATSPSSLAFPQAAIQACRKVQLCRITYISQNCSLVSRPVLEVPPAEHCHADRGCSSP